jgi:hypothetical protein
MSSRRDWIVQAGSMFEVAGVNVLDAHRSWGRLHSAAGDCWERHCVTNFPARRIAST